MIRICEQCGREFEPKEEWHRYCSPDCHRAAKGGAKQPPRPQRKPQAPQKSSTHTSFQFGSDYLRDGYFEGSGSEGNLRIEVLDSLAMDVAKVLGNQDMKSHQLRRFFNKARGIESKLAREGFGAVRADIYAFKRDVAYQVGREVVPEEFKSFIDRNVELAVQGERCFQRGFLQHFESVLAYYVYFFRDK